MLLINKTLIKMSKGVRIWIFIIALLKMLTLIGTVLFAQTISAFLGDLYQPSLSKEELIGAIVSAVFASLLILVADLLTGEAEYRCGAKARISLRKAIFDKILELDVGKVEKIGASNAISSVGDGVELMQVYYTRYLPSLLYSLMAPIYLFFNLKDTSFPVALLLLVISFALPLLNNYFRSMIDQLKKEYWTSFQDLTSYYLESLKSLVTLKLFNQDQNRHDHLKEKADVFNQSTMSIMKMNFSSFLLSDGLIYGGIVVAVCIACFQMNNNQLDFSQGILVLMLSYSFFSSIRQLMNVTHDALSGIAATIKVDEILAMDTTRKQESIETTNDKIIEKYSKETLDYLHNFDGIIFFINPGPATAELADGSIFELFFEFVVRTVLPGNFIQQFAFRQDIEKTFILRFFIHGNKNIAIARCRTGGNPAVLNGKRICSAVCLNQRNEFGISAGDILRNFYSPVTVLEQFRTFYNDSRSIPDLPFDSFLHILAHRGICGN